MTIKHQDEWGRIQYGSGTNRIITAVRQVSSQFDNAYGYTLKLVGVGRAVLQATPRHVSIPWPRDGYADDA